MIHILRYLTQESEVYQLFEGPEVDFQKYCESLIVLAADSALKRCQKAECSVWGADVIGELSILIEERGIFKKIDPGAATFNQTNFHDQNDTMSGLSEFSTIEMVKHNEMIQERLKSYRLAKRI